MSPHLSQTDKPDPREEKVFVASIFDDLPGVEQLDYMMTDLSNIACDFAKFIG
ncbi:hypothetical protein [Vibrio gazogenes]|uniref:hypothetical protein n=1 Tax=Vibrio gazogenes TaxID=687 RepID=UPI001356624D|nr:hypothetical protein [Vibrio gazogenes]